MKLIMIPFMVYFGISTFASQPCTDEEFSKKITTGLPSETKAIVKRIVECNHWSEEVGHGDKARAEQIKAAVAKAKCEYLEKDRSELLKRHSNDAKIKSALATADSWNGVCN